MRFVLAVLAVLPWGFAFAADAGAAAIRVSELPTPAARGSLGASLATGPEGDVWLSWVEPAPGSTPAGHGHHESGSTAPNGLRLAKFEAETGTWGEPRTVVVDASVTPSSGDFPQVAIDGRGEMYTVWVDGHGGARLSTSRDGGATWSAPQPWSKAANPVEKFALARLADGRVLAAWLDGRAQADGHGVQQLYARVLNGTDEGDLRVDASVCDCCQTSLAPFLDGGALVAYRGRTGDEVRDIQTARFRHGRWSSGKTLYPDDWHIKACPMNGPRLASDGGRVGATWFTAAGEEPKVLASFSPDAGARWLMPLRLDRGHPVGHVDTLLLRDSAMVVVWVEADGSLWLRRISPDFALTEPVELAPAGKVALRCVPRAALWRDYAGGHSPAVLLVAYAADHGAGVQTVRVDIPEGDLLTAERNCDCAPSPEQLRGFAIRGTFTALDAARHSAQARHVEVPGVFEAGMHVFAVDPAVFPSLQPNRDFLGRVEWRDGAWRLLDIRLLAAPVR